MPNDSVFEYRGFAITTTCTPRGQAGVAPDRRYRASFTVTPRSQARSSWQHFPTASFGTVIDAITNARSMATVSIDMELAVG